MNSVSCPAILVSAPASGQGKTLATAALARAWRNRGLTVQAFKCGPDFLDSMILERATGHPVYNLDLAMCGLDDGKRLLYHAARNTDVIIVEGVMGLYDGTPSTADIATHFDLPVLLAIDAGGMAQTFASIACGLLSYQSAIKPAGVIANKVGSIGHANMLRDCLPAHIGWFGALQKNDAFTLPERHLGLYQASEIHDLETRIEAAAKVLGESGDLPLPPPVGFREPVPTTVPQFLAGKTIAIARDEAFCFIYPANIDCLNKLGAELVFFSPMNDTTLPAADAYWIPGGYPELHLDRISHNVNLRNALFAAFEADKPILAECGGMMVLSESINGEPAFGLLAGNSQIEPCLQGLGTQHVMLPDGRLGAHTFHYGSFDTPLAAAYQASSQCGQGEAIYQYGSITASFLHAYFPSNPLAVAKLFGYAKP